MKIFISTLFGLVMTANVLADDATTGAASSGYLLGAVSIVSVQDYCDDSSISGATTSCDDKTFGLKIAGGYNFTENFALELGANITGDVEATIYDEFDRVEGTTSATILSAQAVFRAPIGSANIAFKGGFARATVDSEISYSGVNLGSGSDSESSTNTSPMLSVAFEVPIREKIGIFMQYDLVSNAGDKDTVGESDVSFLSAGLKIDF